MTPDELFEARVRCILIDFKICRVSLAPDEVRQFVGRVFVAPKDELDRIAREVVARVETPPPASSGELPWAWRNELRRLGMAKTKKHQTTKTDEKVSYSRWCYAKSLIRRLQKMGFSLTEIGKAVKDSNAWAGSALDYNGMVAERDIAKLETLVGIPNRGHAGRLPESDRLTREDRGRLARIFYALREHHGWTHDLIGNAVGIGSGQVSKVINKGKGGSRPVLDRALAVLAAVQNGTGPSEATRATKAPEATTTAPEPVVEQQAAEEPAEDPVQPEEQHEPEAAVEVPATSEVQPEPEPVAVLDEVTKRLLEAADLLAKMGKRLPGGFGAPWTAKADEILGLAETLQ